MHGSKSNDVLDKETWDKLREQGINSLILWYKVIRLRSESEMLGLLRLASGQVI